MKYYIILRRKYSKQTLWLTIMAMASMSAAQNVSRYLANSVNSVVLLYNHMLYFI